MLNIRSGIWIENTPIFERTIGAISVDIDDIKADLNLFITRDADQLGRFSASVIYVNDVNFALVRHDGDKKGFSGVYLPLGEEPENVKNAVRALIADPSSPLSGRDIKFYEYNDLW